MYQTLEKIENKLALQKTLILCACLFLLFMPDFGFAQAKTFGASIDDLGIPGVKSTNSIAKNLALVLAAVGFLIIIAGFATGLPETIMTFFKYLNDSRKNEDWGPLLKFLGMVFGVIILALVVVALYNKYVVDVANGI